MGASQAGEAVASRFDVGSNNNDLVVVGSNFSDIKIFRVDGNGGDEVAFESGAVSSVCHEVEGSRSGRCGSGGGSRSGDKSWRGSVAAARRRRSG